MKNTPSNLSYGLELSEFHAEVCSVSRSRGRGEGRRFRQTLRSNWETQSVMERQELKAQGGQLETKRIN